MRLLVLGTGRMAANHARHFAAIGGVGPVATVDIERDIPGALCADHRIENRFSSIDAAIAELQKVLDPALVADLDRKEHVVRG